MVNIDAPAMIMFQYKAPRCYGNLDIEYTPKMRIYSDYYADDDRIEVIGEKGILFINRYTAKTVDLPELMLFKDGKTTPIPVEGVEWHDSFIATTHDFIEKLKTGGQPRLDGPTGKAVLQFTLAALESCQDWEGSSSGYDMTNEGDFLDKKLVFALSGGGACGALQVGALYALLEYGLQPDLAIGVSIGAANATHLAIKGFSKEGWISLYLCGRNAKRVICSQRTTYG